MIGSWKVFCVKSEAKWKLTPGFLNSGLRVILTLFNVLTIYEPRVIYVSLSGGLMSFKVINHDADSRGGKKKLCRDQKFSVSNRKHHTIQIWRSLLIRVKMSTSALEEKVRSFTEVKAQIPHCESTTTLVKVCNQWNVGAEDLQRETSWILQLLPMCWSAKKSLFVWKSMRKWAYFSLCGYDTKLFNSNCKSIIFSIWLIFTMHLIFLFQHFMIFEILGFIVYWFSL